MNPMRCDNCGHDRDSGDFCPSCGQSARNFQRALPSLVGEVVREAFEVDSRIVRSLKTLLLRPGALSREFSLNRRADYVSPIRMYLFASLLFFFALSMTAEFGAEMPRAEGAPAAGATASESDIEQLGALLGEVRRARVREILARPESSVARLATVELAGALAENPPGPVGRYMVRYLVDTLHDPGGMFDELLDQLPVAMFVMLPVYAGLLALFYAGRRRYYVEHLVFGLHVHTLTYLVFTVILLVPTPEEAGLAASIGGATVNALLGLLVAYQYLALKRYYGGTHWGTLWRFVGLFIAYAMLLGPGVIAVILLALTIG